MANQVLNSSEKTLTLPSPGVPGEGIRRASALLAGGLATDPRLAQARQLLLAALADHQRRLTGVRPPDPQREGAYKELLGRFARLRGGELYYPYLGSGIGRGALVELADGSVKYDMISGIGVHYLGHGHPAVAAAAFDAATQDLLMQGNLQQNVQSVDLAQSLVQLACRHGAKLEHCFLTTSGAMANENALKMLFQKRHPADRILAFEHAFSGRTLALSQITDKAAFRQGLPATVHVDYVPFFDPDQPQASTERAVAALKQHIARYPQRHAAMGMELVLGEGGFYPGDRAFFAALCDVLKSHGIGLWIDEVQTFGRTTEPFAFQTFGLDGQVDVVTIGKLTQVCATLFTEAYKPKPGLVSQTFTASTSAIFAARAILDELKTGGYFGPEGKISIVHRRFVERLSAIAQRHPSWLRGAYGIGAMVAFTAFDGSADRAKRLLMKLFQLGVIAFIAGGEPSRIRFLPPVGAITDGDIDAVCELLEKALSQEAGTDTP